jgi:hypothetical protein
MSIRPRGRVLRARMPREISPQNGGTLIRLAILERLQAIGVFAVSLPFHSRFAYLDEDAEIGRFERAQSQTPESDPRVTS